LKLELGLLSGPRLSARDDNDRPSTELVSKMTPEDIELLFQSSKRSETSVVGQDGDEDAISDEEKNFRILKLKEILLAAHHAWVSGSEELDIIAENLGDGSRDGWFALFTVEHIARERLF
jgi:hypothetical protein